VEVNLNPDLQAKLDQLALETGRPARELVEDAVAAYFGEMLQTRETLNTRYDHLKSGKVTAILKADAHLAHVSYDLSVQSDRQPLRKCMLH
jgi:predicted transcriptional regulator